MKIYQNNERFTVGFRLYCNSGLSIFDGGEKWKKKPLNDVVKFDLGLLIWTFIDIRPENCKWWCSNSMSLLWTDYKLHMLNNRRSIAQNSKKNPLNVQTVLKYHLIVI